MGEHSYLIALTDLSSGEMETLVCITYDDLISTIVNLKDRYKLENVHPLDSVVNINNSEFINTFDGETGLVAINEQEGIS